MKEKLCPICQSKMIRNGKTSSGRQRWRCKSCGASSVHKNDTRARDLGMFLAWLLSRKRQTDMPCGDRTFRRHVNKFWELWPLARPVDEIHRVVFVDGLWVSRSYVVLIACTNKHTLNWTLARSENSEAWRRLISPIVPPDMVVCDGGSGFRSACSQIWRKTKVQRCLYHVKAQIQRYLTAHPTTGAGIELLKLTKRLTQITSIYEAQIWIEDYCSWLEFWNEFINEIPANNSKEAYTIERLRKAQRCLTTLIKSKTLFTYLDRSIYDGMSRPSTNNVIEGGINAQLREMIHLHRGMSTTRRIKAIFWWCYMHMECPDSYADILRNMPTEKDIDTLIRHCAHDSGFNIGPAQFDNGISWSDFHSSTPFNTWD